MSVAEWTKRLPCRLTRPAHLIPVTWFSLRGGVSGGIVASLKLAPLLRAAPFGTHPRYFN